MMKKGIRNRRWLGLVIVASLTLAASPAAAWGPTGHRTIAKIAEDNIDGRTRAAIDQILGNQDMMEASTWPDDERPNPDPFWQQAGAWHYVTVPKGKHVKDIVHPANGDALTELPKWTATLRDPKTSQADKAKALRFVIHVVSDLHQPLHAYLPEDHGALDFHVSWFGEPESLHWVWDERLITRQGLSFSEYAARLEARTTPMQVQQWWDAQPEHWIEEDIAIRDTIYPEVGADGQGTAASPVKLSFPYYWQWSPMAERRMQMAGVRLAAYLQWVFAG